MTRVSKSRLEQSFSRFVVFDFFRNNNCYKYKFKQSLIKDSIIYFRKYLINNFCNRFLSNAYVRFEALLGVEAQTGPAFGPIPQLDSLRPDIYSILIRDHRFPKFI
jgi:hypothetical protein